MFLTASIAFCLSGVGIIVLLYLKTREVSSGKAYFSVEVRAKADAWIQKSAIDRYQEIQRKSAIFIRESRREIVRISRSAAVDTLHALNAISARLLHRLKGHHHRIEKVSAPASSFLSDISEHKEAVKEHIEKSTDLHIL
jgi:hypothetical protein